MKLINKRTAVAVTCIVLLAGCLIAYGARARSHWPHGPMTDAQGMVVDRITHELELTAQQRLKLDQLAQTISIQRNALRGQEGELEGIVSGEQFDRVKAHELLAMKSAAVQRQAPEVLTALANFYDSLSPTQQQKVREHIKQRRGGRRSH